MKMNVIDYTQNWIGHPYVTAADLKKFSFEGKLTSALLFEIFRGFVFQFVIYTIDYNLYSEIKIR